MAKERNYLRVDAGFFTHKKTNRIRRSLGEVAALYPLKLWAYASLNQTDGDFSDYTYGEIADILGIESSKHSQPVIRAVRALVECGFCDPEDGYSENVSKVASANLYEIPVCLVIHDWNQWNAFFIKGEVSKALGGYKTQYKNFLEKAARARTDAERERWTEKAKEMASKIAELSPERDEDTGTLPRETFPPMGEQGNGEDPPPPEKKGRSAGNRPPCSSQSLPAKDRVNQAGYKSTRSNGPVNGKNGHSNGYSIHPYSRKKAIEESLKAPNLTPLEKAKLHFKLANANRELMGEEPLPESAFVPPKVKANKGQSAPKGKPMTDEERKAYAAQIAKVKGQL